MNKIKKINNQWLDALERRLRSINILYSVKPDLNLERFRSLVSSLLSNHGEDTAISKLKSYRLAIQQFALQQNVVPIPFCKTDMDGVPRCVSFLKPNRNDVDSVTYCLSVLRIIEEFRCKPKYLTSTITSSSSASSELLTRIKSFIEIWDGISALPRDLPKSRLILSNKAGPNGPASITCLHDLAALREPGNGLLYESIQEMLKIGISWVDLDKYKTPDLGFKHSKLVLLSDRACKTRVIAIADWWSNVALSGLHDAFMKGLRRLPGDVTYLQDKIPDLVKGLGSYLYSSDMTAFTDRFPIDLEKKVVEVAYGERVGILWKQIITERYFTHPKGDVKYSTGNPMGVLSSWPISTFTHHAVKAFCAHECGIRDYKYLILGDDTLDTDIGVYKYYHEVIKKLGVDISLSKCTQSWSANAEFAKRLFISGNEVTGLPVHLLSGVNKFPEQVLELVRICRERGIRDTILVPGLKALVTDHKSGKLLASILSLPEHVTGRTPLWEPEPDTWGANFAALDEGSQQSLLTLSRESIFWELVQRIDSPLNPNHASVKALAPTHPLVHSLSDSINSYLPEEAYNSDFEEDEYWIYDQWMKGEYQHLVNIPSIDTYRQVNRGHKITKCMFDVYKRLLELSSGNCNIPLTIRRKYSNQELYDIALGRIVPSGRRPT